MDFFPAIIIDSEVNSTENLRKILESYNYIKITGIYNNLIDGFNAVIKEKPLLVFIDVSENTDFAYELIEKISNDNRSCIIFATAFDNSSDFVIRALKAGAREFLAKPVNEFSLRAVLQKARNIAEQQNSGSSGKIFSVFSNKGGIGKTTIAVNLAYNLAEITRKRVALLDLNLQLGDVTTFLDLTPSFDISYVASHLNRIDEAFLLSTLEKYKDNELYVLADPPYLEQAEDITTEQISSALEILKSVFSYIVIDTGSNFDSKNLCSLDASDSILLISMINLPSIRNAQRSMELFKRLEYNESKIKLIINRYLPTDEISIEDIEDALGHPVFWKIPNNYFTVMSSINRGLPIAKIDPKSPINENLIELAGMMSNNMNYIPKFKYNTNQGLSIFNIGSLLKMFKPHK
jgi:pilus assembly protein CpaE